MRKNNILKVSLNYINYLDLGADTSHNDAEKKEDQNDQDINNNNQNQMTEGAIDNSVKNQESVFITDQKDVGSGEDTKLNDNNESKHNFHEQKNDNNENSPSLPNKNNLDSPKTQRRNVLKQNYKSPSYSGSKSIQIRKYIKL